jgi:flagellar biosynthesis GTPase FlhF
MATEKLPAKIEAAVPNIAEVGKWLTKQTKMVMGITCVAITDDATLQSAGATLRTLKALKDDLEAGRKKLKEPFLEGGRVVDNMFKTPTTICTDQVSTFERAISSYMFKKQQERAREEANARAEHQRAQQEAAAKAAEAQQKAEEARDAGNFKAAERHEAKAEKFEQKVAEAMPTMPAQPAAKVEGLTIVKRHKARITNKAEFIREVCRREQWGLLDINEAALNSLATVMKGEGTFPGVEWYTTESTQVKR